MGPPDRPHPGGRVGGGGTASGGAVAGRLERRPGWLAIGPDHLVPHHLRRRVPVSRCQMRLPVLLRAVRLEQRDQHLGAVAVAGAVQGPLHGLGEGRRALAPHRRHRPRDASPLAGLALVEVARVLAKEADLAVGEPLPQLSPRACVRPVYGIALLSSSLRSTTPPGRDVSVTRLPQAVPLRLSRRWSSGLAPGSSRHAPTTVARSGSSVGIDVGFWAESLAVSLGRASSTVVSACRISCLCAGLSASQAECRRFESGHPLS